MNIANIVKGEQDERQFDKSGYWIIRDAGDSVPHTETVQGNRLAVGLGAESNMDSDCHHVDFAGGMRMHPPER